MSTFLAGGPPAPPPPPLCGKVYLFSSPSLLDIHLCSQICNTSPPVFGTHHGKIPDSMIHQNQGDSLLVKPACHLISIQDTFSIYLILNVSWIETILTISIAIGTGCNFLHGEDGTKSYHMKTYDNRLTTSWTVCVPLLIDSWLMIHSTANKRQVNGQVLPVFVLSRPIVLI